MKLTSIDSSAWVAEGSRTSCLQTLGSQFTDCSPYIRYSISKCYLLYIACIISLKWNSLPLVSISVWSLVDTFKFILAGLVLWGCVDCLFVHGLAVCITGSQARCEMWRDIYQYTTRKKFLWRLIFVGKQHPRKLNPRKFVHEQLAHQLRWATFTHKNLSPRKFNPRNIVTTKICTFTVALVRFMLSFFSSSFVTSSLACKT